MSGPGYQVVVARLMENGQDDPAVKAEFNEQFGTLMNIIRTTYSATMITDVRSLDLKTMFRPKVILLVTEEITKPAHVSTLHKPLARYVQTGGTLILCCWFITMSTTWAIEGFLWEFTHDWKVAEGTEDYERTNLRLNPSKALEGKFGSDAFKIIEESYILEAVHLKGVDRDDQIYVPAKELNHPGFKVTGMFQDTTPSAFRKHGSGYLGYVGDTKLEHGTQALIVAMLEAATMRSALPNNHKRPRQIHPLPQRRENPPISSKLYTKNMSLSAVSTPKPPEPHPDRVASLVAASSQATANLIQPTQPSPKVATVPSMLPVTRNDITALHRFEKQGSDIYTEDSYGGGFKTPSIHTDLSGPPAIYSESDDHPLADVWNTAGTEIHCPSDKNQGHQGDQSDPESDGAPINKAKYTSNDVIKRGGGEDDDSLYNASINGSYGKTETPRAASKSLFTTTPTPTSKPLGNGNSNNNRNNRNHHESQINSHATPSKQNGATTPLNAALVHYHNNKITRSPEPEIDRMPALIPCNPGCAVCTVLLPAMKCVACRKVQYCSTTCQRVDWEEHKVLCKTQARARISVNGNGNRGAGP